jgi:heptaprenyl diphosphate synthase
MKNRSLICENIFGARALFITGLFIMPALLFNPGTEYRVLQFLFFWFLAWLSGKKTNPVFTLLVIIIIITFNLAVPYGRVLFSVGELRITSGALTAGIHRAVTLQALVMLSRVTVRQDLKIPGTFGELLGESLRIFSFLMNKKFRITKKTLIMEIDNFLLELDEQEIPASDTHAQSTKPVGYVLLLIIIILSWTPWIFVYL